MIYNPIQGTLIQFDISKWNQHENLLKLLSEIRNCRLNIKTDDEKDVESVDQLVSDL